MIVPHILMSQESEIRIRGPLGDEAPTPRASTGFAYILHLSIMFQFLQPLKTALPARDEVGAEIYTQSTAGGSKKHKHIHVYPHSMLDS